MYVTTIGNKILCNFFFAQTLLSSITLGKRFRTKFTYDYNLCLKHNFYRDPPSPIKFWILSRLFCCRKITSWKKIARCFGTNSTRFPLFATLTKPNPLFLARWDSSIFYCINSVHLSHIHRHFIVFEFCNRMIVYLQISQYVRNFNI